MTTIKERTIKGRRYLYASAALSYKGCKERFEKCLGPADMDKKRLAQKKAFYKFVLGMKKDYTKVLFEARDANLRYLPKNHALFLSIISHHYERFLASLYPSELEKYQQEFDIRYVHSTTALEGNTLSLRETGLVLDDGIAPVSRKLREIHEVENYGSVLGFVRGYRKDIGAGLILELHKRIQRNIDDETAGNVRRVQIFIKGSSWEPPPAPVVEDELAELIQWYIENKGVLHPFELAGLFHHKFTQVHPFVDGNGRVGRELLNFILRRNGYPALIVPVSGRQEYLDSLAKADDGDPAPLLEFLFKCMAADSMKVILSFFDRSHEDISKDLEELDPEEAEELSSLFLWIAYKTKEVLGAAPPVGISLDGMMRIRGK